MWGLGGVGVKGGRLGAEDPRCWSLQTLLIKLLSALRGTTLPPSSSCLSVSLLPAVSLRVVGEGGGAAGLRVGALCCYMNGFKCLCLDKCRSVMLDALTARRRRERRREGGYRPVRSVGSRRLMFPLLRPAAIRQTDRKWKWIEWRVLALAMADQDICGQKI